MSHRKTQKRRECLSANLVSGASAVKTENDLRVPPQRRKGAEKCFQHALASRRRRGEDTEGSPMSHRRDAKAQRMFVSKPLHPGVAAVKTQNDLHVPPQRRKGAENVCQQTFVSRRLRGEDRERSPCPTAAQSAENFYQQKPFASLRRRGEDMERPVAHEDDAAVIGRGCDIGK